jgi:hypothetical protein
MADHIHAFSEPQISSVRAQGDKLPSQPEEKNLPSQSKEKESPSISEWQSTLATSSRAVAKLPVSSEASV